MTKCDLLPRSTLLDAYRISNPRSRSGEPSLLHYHFSFPGLISISHVKPVLGCVLSHQYASAIASGETFPYSPISQSLVPGTSMIPSMTACATWIPSGPNSLARDWAMARTANFMLAKAAKRAEPLTEAVAPVKINDGGWGVVLVDDCRSGSTA